MQVIVLHETKRFYLSSVEIWHDGENPDKNFGIGIVKVLKLIRADATTNIRTDRIWQSAFLRTVMPNSMKDYQDYTTFQVPLLR